MIFFLVKKAFFDMWDNMIAVFLLNLGFVLVAAGALYVPYFLSFDPALAIPGGAIGILLLNVYLAAASFVAHEITNYATPSFKDLQAYLKSAWKAGLTLGVITCVQIGILAVAMPFYLQLGGLLGMTAVAVIFWISVIWWLASQYYFPIRTRLDSGIRKILRKSFIVFFDNAGFTIAVGMGTVVILALSVFTAFLLPGAATVLIWHQSALKLRLLKYDYLEKNPGANRKDLPWDALLVEESERVGHRSLRGMIFPWKD